MLSLGLLILRFLKTLRATVTDSVEDPTVINQEDQKVVSDLDKQILETYL